MDTMIQDIQEWLPLATKGRLYGALLAEHDNAETQAKMRETGMYLSREAIYFYEDTHTGNIDKLLDGGFMVQINFNWKPTSVPVTFPTDKKMIRNRAEQFFSYYEPRKDQIPLVVNENEYDNDHYRDWNNTSIDDYLEELAIVTEVGHEYGFKVADAAITGNNLERWTWCQLRGEMADWWEQRYFVGKNNAYWRMVALVTKFAMGVRDIPIDYINHHWYNEERCHGGLSLAIACYKRIIGKIGLPLVNNEWGLDINSQHLFEETKKEVENAGAHILVAYSGVNEPGKPIRLTDEMLSMLH